MAIRFFFDFNPEIISISDFGTLRVFEKRAIRSALAFPSTGGDVRCTFIWLFSVMEILFFEDLGDTVMSKMAFEVMVMYVQQ